MERLKLFLTAAVWTITTTILAQSSWNQLGDAIDGSSGDGLGSAIAMSADGTIVAIGASSADNTGVVRVYEKSGANWNQIGTDISGDEMNDSFGLSVSLSDDGSVVAIGANTSDIFDDFAASGYVKVYERSADTWVLKGSKLIASNSGEFFGQSVSLSSDGEVLAVGAPGYNGAGSLRGVTRIYKWTSTSWAQIGADVEGTFDYENLGTSVSLQVSDTDSLLVVGSPAYETTTSAFDNAGRVLIYRDSEGSWGGSWSSPDVLIGQPNDYFGWSVSLSADQNRIAVGAPQDLFASDNYYGMAKIFEYDGSDWLQMGDSIPSLEGDGSQVDGDEFGKAVRLSSDGSYAIIGAPLQEATVSPNGRVEIYNWSGTAWEIVGDSIPGDDSNDGFGSAVAISADGLTIAATSTIHNSGAGQAKLFNYGVPDNIAPVVTVNALTTSDQTPELSGTIDDESATISVTVNGQTNTPTINSGLNTWTLADNTLTTLDEGSYDVVVSATDAANNTGTDATDNELTIDLTAPTVTIDTLYTQNQTPTITGTVDDPDATITVSINGEPYDATNNEDGTWSYTVLSSLAESAYSLTATATDPYSNQSDEVEGYLKIDLTAPQPFFFNAAVTGFSLYDTPISEQPILAGIYFDGKSSDFVLADITISGNVGDIGLSYAESDNYYILAIPLQDEFVDQEISVSIPAGVFTDLAGNANLEASVTISFDITAPTVASIAPVGNDTTNLSSIPIQIVFDEKTIEFESADLTTSNVTSVDNLTTTDSLTYTMDVVPTAEGALTVQLPADAVKDLAGNTNSEASEVLQIVYDATTPTAEISTTTTITTSSTLEATITFSEEVVDFVEDSLTITNGTLSDLSTSDNMVYSVLITPNAPVEGSTSGVDVSLALEANKVLDIAGNGNTSSNSVSITFDAIAPILDMTTQSGQPLTTASGPFDAYFSFSEALGANEALTTDDLTVTNGSKSGFETLNVFGTIFYRVTITPDAGVQDLSVSVAAGVVTDAAGNPNAATSFSVTIDTQGPIVTISSTVSSPTKTSPISVTFTFDEEVNFMTFSADDLVAGNFTASEPTTEDNITYTSNISPTAQGELSISLKEGVVEDLAGNTNTETGSFTITYDDVPPTVTITGVSGVNNTNPATMTFTFSEAVTGFTLDDISVTNATKGSFSGSGAVYTADITPSGAGAITVSVAENTVTDVAGNANATGATKEIAFDATRPTVTITGAPQAPVTSKEPVTFTFTFSEVVSGFTLDDISVTNATASELTDNNPVFTAKITPLSIGTISLTVAENVTTDLAGNGNLSASESFTFSQPYSGGTGTESDPYLIANGQDFMDLTENSGDWSSHFRQTADINFGGALLNEITTFSGSYDGSDFKLENYRHGPGNFRVFSSLFYTISEGAVISNIQIVNDFRGSSSSFGGFSILAEDCFGVVENCSYTGRIAGVEFFFGFVGTLGNGGRMDNVKIDLNLSIRADDGGVSASGLASGIDENAIVRNCSVNGSMTLNTAREKAVNISGIASANRGRIENTTINLVLSTSTSGAVEIGGLVRNNQSTGVIALCEAFGSIVAPSGSGTSGIAHENSGQIQDSYSNMSSNVGSHGGLVYNNYSIVANSFSVTNNSAVYLNFGEIRNSYSSSYLVTGNGGTISNCYSFSPIERTAIGFPDAKITNSFWLSQTGTEESTNGALPKTQSQLTNIKTYTDAGWDFDNIWFYPFSFPVHKWLVDRHKPFTVTGKVIDENGNPFTNGVVKGSQAFQENASAPIDESGNFTISLPKGFNHLGVVPNTGSPYYTTFLSNTINPSKAHFAHYERTGVVIQMIPVSQTSKLDGNGRISGNVVKSASGGRIVQGRKLQGDPLEGVTVFLVRVSDEEIMTSVVTDASGKFEITGIPAGKYQLVLDVAGIDLNLEGSTFDMDEEGTPLTISAAVSEDGVSFAIEEVLGVMDEIAIEVYPNPVSRFVNVQVTGEASIRIMDLKGTVLTEQSFTNEIELNVENLKESIYLMEIRNVNGVSVRKLIKR